jgi:hypothetical protein
MRDDATLGGDAMAMKKSSRRGASKREGAERSTSGKPMQTKTPRYAKTRRTRAGTSPKGEAVATKSGPSKTKARGAATAKPATAKPATAKPATAKPATAKPATAKPADAAPAKAAASLLRGSAGKKILADLGLTNEELHAFLPADAPKWVRSVLWCQFDLARSLEEIEAHFRGRFETSMHEDVKFPPDGPDQGIPVRSVTVRPASRYVAYTFYGMRGEQYVESGSYQLEAAFGESGTTWGSNRAVYERFKALELPELGATNVRELTE